MRDRQRRPLSGLRPWERNYNRGDVHAIAASIQRWGFNGALRVWDGSLDEPGTVIAGNHTYLALLQLKDEGADPPMHVGIAGDGDWLVDCIDVSHLSFREAEAFAISDNRTAALAEPDDTKLLALLREIPGEDLEATGYDIDDVENLMRRMGELEDDRPAAPEARLDRLKELKEEWGTAPGQLWVIPSATCPGREHRIVCGDSTDGATIERLMAGERAVLFATDPPYLVDYDGTNHPTAQGTGAREKRIANKDWDEVYDDKWDDASQGAELYRGFIRAAVEHAIATDAAWYCWHASRRQAMLEGVWEEFGAFVHQQIIWAKSRGVLTRSWYLWSHEPCFFGWIRGQKPKRVADNHPGSVWQVATADADTTGDHPTSKPTALWELPIEQHTSRGDLIYEPFSGSGTALVAAERTGRIAYACELQPAFVAVALDRLTQMGLAPRLESTEPVTETVTEQ